MNQRQNLGRYGEQRAAIYLEDRGYQIIERNWRTSSGEIDLIASKAGLLVFIEVKTRNGSGYGHPFESITPEKVARMRRLAAEWCAAKEVRSLKVRLDAVSILISAGRVSIEHLKQVL
ncbi:MAG: YraN family protein [Rhodoluna sp.]